MRKLLNPQFFIPASVFTAFFFFFSAISVYRYNIVQVFQYDLGVFASIIWQLSQGKLALINHISLGQINFLGDHFQPSLALLSPLFWLIKDIRILLIEQALATTLSGFVIYLIARKRKLNIWLSLVFSFVFFIFAGTAFPLVTDWHPEPTAGFFLLLFYYFFVYSKRRLTTIILAIIFLGFKESNALTLSFLLISFWFIFKQRRREIILYLISSLVWFVSAVKLIIPHFSGREYFYSPQLPTNIDEIKQSLFQLSKYEFVWKSFLSFGFLPLLARFGLIPVFGEILIRILPLHSFFESFSLRMHYNVYLGIFLTLAAVDGFIRGCQYLSTPRVGNAKYYTMAFALLLLAFSLFVARKVTESPVFLVTNKVFWREFKPRNDIYDSLKRVPKIGSIASQNNLLPHFVFRNEDVLSIQKGYMMKNPEIIVFDLSEGQSPNNFFPENYDFLLKEKTLIEKSKLYRRIPAENSNIYIYVLRQI